MLLVGVFAVGSEALVVSPVLADIAATFDSAPGVIGTLVSAYALAVGLAALIAGPVSDRVAARSSRRFVILSALVVFAVATMGCALAPWLWLVFVCRAVAGAAAGVFIPAAYAFAGDVVPPRRRATMMGVVMSGWAASMILGVPLGGLIGQFASWRWAFGVLGMLAATAATAVMVLQVPASAEQGVSKAEAAQSGSLREVLGGAVTALRLPGIPVLLVVTLCNMFGFYGVYTYLGSFLRRSLELGSAGAGGLILVYGLGLATEPLVGRLADAIGAGRLLRASLAALVLLIAALPHVANSVLLLILVLLAWGVCQGAVLVSLSTLLSERPPYAYRGRVFALYSAFTYLGGVMIGAALMGSLLTWQGFTGVAYACSAVTAGGALLMWTRPAR